MLKVPKSGVIQITFFVNPHHFYFKYEDDLQVKKAVVELEKQIENLVQKRSYGHEPAVGELVLLHHVGRGVSKWIRARVDHIYKYLEGPQFVLWAIDYGFPIKSTSQYIRYLQHPNNLKSLKVRSIFKGGLNGIVPANTKFDILESKAKFVKHVSWSPKALHEMAKLTFNESSLIFRYEGCIGDDHLFGTITVQCFNGKTISLNNHLKELDEALDSTKNFVKDYKSLHNKPYWTEQEVNEFYKIEENANIPHQKEEAPKSTTSIPNYNEESVQRVNEWVKDTANAEAQCANNSKKDNIAVYPNVNPNQSNDFNVRKIDSSNVRRLINGKSVDLSPITTDRLCDKLEKLDIANVPLNKRYDLAQNRSEKENKNIESNASVQTTKVKRIEEKVNLIPAGFNKQSIQRSKKCEREPVFSAPSTSAKSTMIFTASPKPFQSPPTMERPTSHYNRELNDNRFNSQIDRMMLVHSHESVVSTSISSVAEAHFSDEVHAQLKKLGYNSLYRVQTYGWPHLMRGNSLVLVNSKATAKTATYLPAVCSLINERISDNKIETCVGPVIIIIATSSTDVEKITKDCRNLLRGSRHQIRCEPMYGQTGQTEQIRLLNGFEILITTVPCLYRLMQDTLNLFHNKRISTIVFDNIDLIFNKFVKETFSIYKRFCDPETSTNIQVIVTARTWHKVLEKFCQRKDVLLCIGAYIEAALYANTDISVTNSNKNDCEDIIIAHLVEKYYEEQLTVIVCRDFGQIKDLEDRLKAESFSVNCCHKNSSNTAVLPIHITIAKQLELMKQEKQEGVGFSNGPFSVLICDDEILPDLNIRHAQHIIHYWLPSHWTTFCQRFALSFNYHENFLQQNRTPKGRSSSLIFVDENNNEALPRLIEFMKTRCNTDVPDHILKLAEKKRIEREENRTTMYNPFCTNLLTLGECYNENTCSDRHVLIKSDQPREEIPRNGSVRFQIITIHTPVHFTVRLLEHKAINRPKYDKIPCSNDYISFQMDIRNYFKKESNHIIHSPPKLGDLCIIEIEDEQYKRCKIIDVDKSGIRSKLKLLLIDTNEHTSCTSKEVMVLPDQFKYFPPQAVDMRISGVVPPDMDTKWDTKTLKNVTNWINSKPNTSLEGQIELALMNCIWVKTIQVVEKLSTFKNDINVMSIKANLIDKNFGVADMKALQLLREMAENMDILDTQTYVVQLVPSSNQVVQRRGRRGDTLAQRPNHKAAVVPFQLDSSQSSTSKPISKQNLTTVHRTNSSQLTSSSSSDDTSFAFKDSEDNWAQLMRDEFYHIVVSNFWSPDRFYIRRHDTSERFRNLEKKIDEFVNNSENFKPVINLKVDDICLAKIEQYWDRAKVLSVNDNDVRVFFVDSGRTKTLNISDIKAIPNSFNELPFQAILCKITGIRPLNNTSWSEETCDKIFDEILEKCSEIFVRIIQRGKPDKLSNEIKCYSYEAVFYDKTLGNINKLIVKSGYAENDPTTFHFIDSVVDRNFLKPNDDDESDESDWDQQENPSFDAGDYLKNEEEQYHPLLRSNGTTDEGGSDREIDIDIQFDEEHLLELLGLPPGSKFLKPNENNSSHQYVFPPSNEEEKIKEKTKEIMLPDEPVTKQSYKVEVPQTNLVNSALKNPAKVPSVIWHQTNEMIVLTISAPDVPHYYLKVTSRLVHFCYEKDEEKYAILLNLFGCIDVDYVAHEIRGLNVIVRLLKTIPSLSWPRLLTIKGRNQFIKYKFNENEEIFENFDDGHNNINYEQDTSSEYEDYDEISDNEGDFDL